MAEDQGAAEEGKDDTGSAATDAPAEDPKERYRQALERKKAQSGRHGQGQASGNASAKGSSAKAGGKREFRRKSG